jgi:D-aminoacyl-tRNA deacylase
MKFAVIYSKKDEAGKNIAEALKNHFLPQVPIIEFSKETINLENIDQETELKNAELIIFASKHASAKGGKTLSIHAPGNWRNADYGGKASKVCPTSSLAIKYLFQKLNENAKALTSDYQVTLECTHHGPLISKPCLFIEVGATESEWTDRTAAGVVAKTIADFQNFKIDKNIKTAVGIGGPHYCPNFNKIQNSKESNLAISHIIPEYALPLTESMIIEAIEKTKEHTDLIILDHKGCGNAESRNKLTDLLTKLGLKYQRTSDITKEEN